MGIDRRTALQALGASLLLTGCRSAAGGDRVGVAFETLQTEYWTASFQAIRRHLERHDLAMLEAVADGDPSRQLEQVNSFITRGVQGIIVAPKDRSTVVPIIRAANRADVPIVLYNRPPAENSGTSVTVVADNRGIAAATVRQMCQVAQQQGGHYKAMVLMGDLADQNGMDRRDGFDDAVGEYPELVEVVARIPTEWNQERAHAGVTNALQAHPDINFIFSSSDFLFPSLVSALKTAGKYEKIGHPDHVLLGGFDGDATAYQMLLDGYLDADGVQDVEFECEQSVQAILDWRAGKELQPIIRDPGFVIHQGNLEEAAERMWGAQIVLQKSAPAA